jgi:hypothetical protein
MSRPGAPAASVALWEAGFLVLDHLLLPALKGVAAVSPLAVTTPANSFSGLCAGRGGTGRPSAPKPAVQLLQPLQNFSGDSDVIFLHLRFPPTLLGDGNGVFKQCGPEWTICSMQDTADTAGLHGAQAGAGVTSPSKALPGSVFSCKCLNTCHSRAFGPGWTG